MSQTRANVGLRSTIRIAFVLLAMTVTCAAVLATIFAALLAQAWLPASAWQSLLKVAALPGMAFLACVYGGIWIAAKRSERAVAPMVWLAEEVQGWDSKDPNFRALGPERLPAQIDGESLVLSQAIHSYARRLSEFVERERNFTRDASHELRTPLTVIKMASQVLISDSVLDPYATRNVERIQSSARDMEALIEAFLLIAREAENALPADDFAVNSVVREELERAESLVGDREIELQLIERAQFRLHAPSKVVAVLIGNLIRNAVSFTDRGHVRVTIGDGEVAIEDTGIGMSPEDLKLIFQPFFRAQHGRRGGHGVGLAIVKRLSDRYRWPIEYESTPGKGTRVTVRFPDRMLVGVPSPNARNDALARMPQQAA
jgi:signal transduction histidine kinase